MVAMEAPSPPGTGGRLGQFPSTSVSCRRRLGVNRGNLGDVQAFCYLLGKSLVWSNGDRDCSGQGGRRHSQPARWRTAACPRGRCRSNEPVEEMAGSLK